MQVSEALFLLTFSISGILPTNFISLISLNIDLQFQNSIRCHILFSVSLYLDIVRKLPVAQCLKTAVFSNSLSFLVIYVRRLNHVLVVFFSGSRDQTFLSVYLSICMGSLFLVYSLSNSLPQP